MDVWVADVRWTSVDNDIEYVYSVKRRGDNWTASRRPLGKASTISTTEILTESYQWRPLSCPSACRPLKDDNLKGMVFFLTGRAIDNFVWD